MVEIIFQNKQEAIRLYSHFLLKLNNTSELQTILLNEDRYMVKVMVNLMGIPSLRRVKCAFYDFIVNVKRNDWFRSILKDTYYYDDVAEQDHIIEIIDSILEGDKEELAVFIKEGNEKEEIMEAIDYFFAKNLSFSFESFIKFRLRSYFQKLEMYVGVSIDEYKMEQEYQMFIQTLRDFLAQRQPKMDELHVVFGEEVSFFDENLREIPRKEVVKMIDRKLLVNHPVYVDSFTIAPLLSIAPSCLNFYCTDREMPLIRTIENIFEERIRINSMDDFEHISRFPYEKHTN